MDRLIGLDFWLSKSQVGMSSTARARGVPGLISILISRPSRCMRPATARIVVGRLTVWVHDVVSAATGWPPHRK